MKRRNGTRGQGKCESKLGQKQRSKEWDRLNTGRKRTGRQIKNSWDGEPPIDAASKLSRQRGMLSGPAVALMKRSNKRFKPGD